MAAAPPTEDEILQALAAAARERQASCARGPAVAQRAAKSSRNKVKRAAKAARRAAKHAATLEKRRQQSLKVGAPDRKSRTQRSTGKRAQRRRARHAVRKEYEDLHGRSLDSVMCDEEADDDDVAAAGALEHVALTQCPQQQQQQEHRPLPGLQHGQANVWRARPQASSSR